MSDHFFSTFTGDLNKLAATRESREAEEFLRVLTDLPDSKQLIKVAIDSLKAFKSLHEDDSVAAWSKTAAAKWRDKLANTTSPEMLSLMGEYHFRAKYGGGSLISFAAKTADGTDRAGSAGANIAEVEVQLLLRWSSLVRTDGKTQLAIILYPAGNVPSTSSLVFTNAVVTKKQLRQFCLKGLPKIVFALIGLCFDD